MGDLVGACVGAAFAVYDLVIEPKFREKGIQKQIAHIAEKSIVSSTGGALSGAVGSCFQGGYSVILTAATGITIHLIVNRVLHSETITIEKVIASWIGFLGATAVCNAIGEPAPLVLTILAIMVGSMGAVFFAKKIGILSD